MINKTKNINKINKIKTLIQELHTKDTKNYGNDFLLTNDKTNDQLEATILVAEILKELRNANISPRVFDSGIAMSWFRDNSTRTKYSFKSASNLLGLSVENIDEQKSQIAHGETTRETANMISFLSEYIGIRDDKYLGEGHKFQKQVSQAIDMGYKEGILPQRTSVLNLQCDVDHPTQSLADLVHLKTYFGGLENLRGKKIAMTWAYSPSYGKPLSVAQGTISLLTRFGMHVSLAYPKGYNLIPEIEKKAFENAKKYKGKFEIVDSMDDAFRDSDIVYPKSWASYSAMQQRVKLYRKSDCDGIKDLEKKELEENAKHNNWECTEEKMKLTKNKSALYMHCLPADVSGLSCNKGEVQQSVFERYKVETFKEAGYKPYVIAAMMLLTRFNNPADILKNVFQRETPQKLVLY